MLDHSAPQAAYKIVPKIEFGSEAYCSTDITSLLLRGAVDVGVLQPRECCDLPLKPLDGLTGVESLRKETNYDRSEPPPDIIIHSLRTG